jgi:hypothetical protein
MSLHQLGSTQSVTGWKLGALTALLIVGGACQQAPEPEPESAAAPRQASRALITPGFATEMLSTGQEVVAGELLVRFRGDTEAVAAQAHGWMGARVLHTYRSVPGLQRISLPPGTSVELAMAAYAANPDVLYAEPNALYSIAVTPDDPDFDDLWGLNNTGQSGGTVDADLNMPEAWDITTGGEETVIAVIDTGINYLHEDLADNLWINPGEVPENEVDDDGNGYVDDVHGINAITGSGDPLDDNRHGSHCSGTIAGRGNNAKGVAGVNWQAKLIGCKFLSAAGSGATADAVECMDYLHGLRTRTANPVNIVATSNSWGGGTFSQALQDAIARHLDAGMLFIAAAGNNTANNDTTNTYPANYPLPNVVSVAAIARTDTLATFSNYGRRRVHVGAPGVDILSTVLGQDYALLSGTSMATPHVSGLVGLLKAQDPSRDWRALKNLVIAGGVDSVALKTRTISGKRIRAADVGGKGSLTCDNQLVTSKLAPMADTLQVLRGAQVEISALHINCGAPAGPLELTVSPGGGTVSLADDGQGLDRVAGDGLYTTQWQPPGAGTYTLTFPNNEILTVTAMDVYRPAVQVPFEGRAIAGTPLNITDGTVVQVLTPFPVRYGNHLGFDTAWVSSDGYLSFTDSRFSSTNARLPTTNWGTLVAPFWDNLHTATSPPGNVYHEVLGTAPNREWVIEWRNIGNYSRRTDTPYPTATFQVVFKEGSSEVIFNYMDVDFRDGTDTYDRGGSATVGVQVISTDATLHSYNVKSLTNLMTLVFATNAPPVVSALQGSPATVTEGGALDLTATFADADGSLDAPWTAEFDFDYVGTTFTVDASQTVTDEGDFTVNRTFPQSGRYVVALRMKDRDNGSSALRTLVMHVRNEAPVATVPQAVPNFSLEGMPVSLEASFSDVGVTDGPWKVEWDFDYDGTTFAPDHVQTVAAQGPFALEHIFRQDGTFTVGMRVLDKDNGASDVRTTTVTIEDVQPGLRPLFDFNPIEEGADYQLLTSFFDQGDHASPWRVEFDLDYDGTTFDVDRHQTYTQEGDVTFDHVFGEDGPRVVAVRVVDADGSISNVQTSNLDVWDAEPEIIASSSTPLISDEPQVVQFHVTAISGSPRPETDPVRYYYWDFEGDGEIDHVGSDPIAVHRYRDNPPGRLDWQAQVHIEDEDGRVTQLMPIVVRNRPPTLAAVAPTHAATEGARFELPLTATDPAGAEDPLTWQLTGAPAGMSVSGTGLVQWTPSFPQTAAAGRPYTITVTVSDDDGGQATASFTVSAAWLDQDGDSMPDTWERANGMDPTRDDSTEDSDRDGVSNSDESRDAHGGPRLPGRVSAVQPLEGEHKRTQGLTLVVDNTTDPDSPVLTYEFALYSDAALTQEVATATAAQGGAGRTSGTLDPTKLSDDSWYWWRARASDGALRGPWSAPQRIYYNPINGVPGLVLAISPVSGVTLSSTRATLTVLDARDPEEDALTYEFVVYKDAALSQEVARTSAPAHGSGQTSVDVDATRLEDNSAYWWQARASDGMSQGAWSSAQKFTYNPVNGAPGAPLAISPLSDTRVNTAQPVLVVYNAKDPDGDALSYEFAIAQDAAFTQPAATLTAPEDGSGQTSVTVLSALTDDTVYWWRARASDGKGQGPWSAVQRFVHNPDNGAPGAPVALSPSSGAATYDAQPVLIVLNARDPDGDVLTYEFEVHAGPVDGELVANASTVAAGESGTRFLVPKALDPGAYTWRARATDSRGAQGAWSDAAAFQVTEVKPPSEPVDEEEGCSTASGSLGGLLSLWVVALGLRRRRP